MFLHFLTCFYVSILSFLLLFNFFMPSPSPLISVSIFLISSQFPSPPIPLLHFFAPFLEGVGMHKACCRCLPSNLPIHLFVHFSRQFIYRTNENTPVQLNPSPVNPVIQVQLKLPGEFVQLANSLQFP